MYVLYIYLSPTQHTMNQQNIFYILYFAQIDIHSYMIQAIKLIMKK